MGEDPVVFRAHLPLEYEPAALQFHLLRHLNLSEDLRRRHAATLRALGLLVGLDDIPVPLMERIKWDRPFRYHPAQHAHDVAIDAAMLFARTRGGLAEVVVWPGERLCPTDWTFIGALQRIAPMRVRVLYSGPVPEAVAGQSSDLLELVADWGEEAAGESIVASTPYRERVAELVKALRGGGAQPAEYLRAAAACLNAGYYAQVVAILRDAPTGSWGERDRYLVEQNLFMAAFNLRDPVLAGEASARQLTLASQINETAVGVAHYNIAMHLLRLRQPRDQEGAIRHLNAALRRVTPEAQRDEVYLQAFLRNGVALAYSQLGRLQEAASLLGEARALLEPFEDDDRARIEKATFLYNWAQLALMEGDLRSALERLDRVQEVEPHLGYYWVERGNWLFQTEDYRASLEAYRRALITSVPNESLLFNMAVCWEQLGEEARAADGYEEVLRRYPGNADAVQAVTELLLLAGEHKRLVDMVAPLVDALESADCFSNYALAMQELGETERAVEYFKRALAAQPQHVNAMVNLAAVRFDQGDVREAETLLRQALQIDPSHEVALSNLGYLEGAAGASA